MTWKSRVKEGKKSKREAQRYGGGGQGLRVSKPACQELRKVLKEKSRNSSGQICK